ncbi:hypothetical protein BDQ12DRAFT_113425 [Crucibulum laeve]|uniref:Uncharacterized protein n=1 Tax=Crucibulum laeve TaxID=68775 RepID=A0A5C3M015_9AGAR|nr:hypothetical protein BDQ12DRAFT_113425 [Crucibulum laeve]
MVFLAPFISEIDNIPRGKDLSTSNIRITSRIAIGYGAKTDVFAGEWDRPEGIVKVAIKVTRGSHLDKHDEAIIRRLVRETHTWFSAQWHPNVQVRRYFCIFILAYCSYFFFQ